MRRYYLSILCVFALAMLCFGRADAQKVTLQTPYPQSFIEAYGDFEAKNYSAAYDRFGAFLLDNPKAEESLRERATYYRAVSSCQLMNKDADMLLSDFIRMYPNSSFVNPAYFLLADFYCREEQYDKAEEVFKKMDITSLDTQERYEYYYKHGHCLFMLSRSEEALAELEKVKGSDSKYSAAASYFYGHILYERGEYDLALKEFLALQSDRNFGKIVPYYIAHIYYYRQNYEELVQLAPALSEKSQSKRSGELNRMLGDAYYKLGRYNEAVPYLEKAAKEQSANAQDYYLLGFALMQQGNHKDAKPYLEKASANKDSLSQNALYHLGICCLETGDKSGAMAMFKEAYELEGDNSIKERALLNYAKTSFETAPAYNESVKAFQTFVDEFPSSEYADEAKGYLAQLYGRMKNYRDAIELIEQMTQRNHAVNAAYQRLCLNRAIEVFNENRPEDALIYLDKSLTQAHDNALTATAYYLKAEAYYQMDEYELAIKNLNTFYSTPGADKSPYLSQADYAMGYNLFKQKKYSLAKGYFQRAVGEIDEPQSSDAKLRLADCLFMGRDYGGAIEKYGEIAANKGADADYACYQSAMAYGATGNYAKKKEVLENGFAQFGARSNYAASIKYELANTYLTLDENQKAIETYRGVIETYPTSLHVKDCYVKIGMIYYKIGEDDKAVASFDKVIKQYPDSEESRSALANMQAIYVSQNKVDDFIAYTEKLPSARISLGEQDSISFQAAENLYMDANCEGAILSLRAYLSKYPDGAFVTTADYYLADCLYKSGDTASALSHYENVVSKPKNIYTEKSLLKAAEINLAKKNYPTAKEEYARLEQTAEISSHRLQAVDGLMQSCFHLSQFDTATMYANRLLSLDKVDESTKERANYVLAKSLLANGNTGQAIEEFTRLGKAKNPEYAAEAQYILAELNYSAGNLEASEKIIHQINANPSSEYWLAKTFILWADIFQAKGNTLQAKQTLQSIIDNYDGDEELVETARQKLLAISGETERKKQEDELSRQQRMSEVDEVIIEQQEQ